MKNLLPLFLLLCALTQVHSQNITDIGNTWRHYGINWITGERDSFLVQAHTDTVINNKVYTQLWRCDNFSTSNCYLHQIIREENRKVYQLDDSNLEYILYDFTLEPGDSIELYGGLKYVVTNYLDSILFSDNTWHKRLTLYHYFQNTEGLNCHYSIQWIENWGEKSFSLTCPDESTYHTVNCYYGDTEVYFGPECNKFLAINESEPTQFSVSPNPGTGLYSIQFESRDLSRTIKLLNLQGKEIYQSNAPDIQHEMLIEGAAPGMYILQVNAKGKGIGSKKIVLK